MSLNSILIDFAHTICKLKVSQNFKFIAVYNAHVFASTQSFNQISCNYTTCYLRKERKISNDILNTLIRWNLLKHKNVKGESWIHDPGSG